MEGNLCIVTEPSISCGKAIVTTAEELRCHNNRVVWAACCQQRQITQQVHVWGRATAADLVALGCWAIVPFQVL